MQRSPPVVITRFFGLFFAMFQSSGIWGNVISATVLKPVMAGNETDVAVDLALCGVGSCPGGNGTDVQRPEKKTVRLRGFFSV